MPEWWPAVVFGWPTVVVSVVLAAPFSYYLSGASPWVALLASTIPFAIVAGAYAVKCRLGWLAWCLLAPFFGVAIWLAVAVVSQ